MNIFKLMSNQYSMFHTTIPQGKVVSLDEDNAFVQKGKMVDNLTIMDDLAMLDIKSLDCSRQKKTFTILKAIKIKKIVLLIYNNIEQSMRFSLKSNGCSIQDIALIKPVFITKNLDNPLVLPRMFSLFQDAFSYYEIVFPFYLYCKENDILELFSQNDIHINKLPAYNVSYSYLDPILIGGRDLLHEKSIEDLFGSDSKLVSLEKVVSDHRYAACFDHKNICIWTTDKGNIVASLSCLLSKYNIEDPSISEPDHFKPDLNNFIRVISLLSQDKIKIFTINNILELLHLTKASELMISFVNSLCSICIEEERVIFKSISSLSSSEFSIAKALYHILYRFSNDITFIFKNKIIRFGKWSY